ncbi:gamma carbonic anhydrase family protein [Senegalia massiliensis]|uniref:gamma carbonic anhydrase family protein n=1 Tax=Senegalia massiliensis TaxID=1720316 RepID=UPI0010319406|nr:gamma carbonic anhydrase family protein [Senegalia massiliensis]
MIKSFEEFTPKIDETCFVAESSDIIGNVIIGKDSNVWYNTVLRGDVNKIVVGEKTNIQDGTIIHVEKSIPTIIGNNVTIGHKAIVHACTLSDNVLVGMGAIILNGAIIEENVLIGAGSVVTPGKTIPSGHLALGSPARVIRKLTDEEINDLQKSADNYVSLSKKHK